VQGSHHIYGKSGNEVRLSVPVHKNQTLKIGLLKHFLKQAGLTEQDV
jgi:predicted RNA binding protein YcfA (HicA-like mRNA interferase family)